MDFDPVIENLPRLLSGFVLTLELTAISLACGMLKRTRLGVTALPVF